MSVWQGLENQRMEGEEEKDAGLSGKGDRNTENAPHKRGKARRHKGWTKKRRWRPKGRRYKGRTTREDGGPASRSPTGVGAGGINSGHRYKGRTTREDGGLKAAATRARNYCGPVR